MTVEEAIALIEQLLPQGRLTKVQEIVFRQSWAGQTYLDMAVEFDYDPGHIKDVGSELWRSFSKSVRSHPINKMRYLTVSYAIAQNNRVMGKYEC